MNRLFWGLLFCLLDYKFTIGTATFELLPDFIGFFLMMKGMEELAGRSKFFDRGRYLAFVMMIASAIGYGADLMNPRTMTRVWLWILELAVLISLLVLLRLMICGIGQLAEVGRKDLGCDRLRAMWMVLAVLNPICHLLSWIPLVGTVCAAASVVMGTCFLIAMYGTRKRFCKGE